jgi:polyisoprenoid-binding protein YceI
MEILMNTLIKRSLATLVATAAFSLPVSAAEYMIDHKGAHAFINFKIKHLGYSWLTGRFNTFSGTFNYDEKDITATTVNVDIDTRSFDSNHAERDKHIKGKDFLDTATYPKATFSSTKITAKNDNEITVIGDLTLHGVTSSVTINAEKIGEGEDPWGGYRAGFSGTTTIGLKQFGIAERLGPASTQVQLELHIEGIRQ